MAWAARREVRASQEREWQSTVWIGTESEVRRPSERAVAFCVRNWQSRCVPTIADKPRVCCDWIGSAAFRPHLPLNSTLSVAAAAGSD